MGYRLNCLDEPIFMALPKAMLTQFGLITDWRVLLDNRINSFHLKKKDWHLEHLNDLLVFIEVKEKGAILL